jgi:hypothetical protein
MADAEDLKSRQGIWQRTASKRSTAKIACVYVGFESFFHALPRTLAKQKENPSDTTTDTISRRKANNSDSLAEEPRNPFTGGLSVQIDSIVHAERHSPLMPHVLFHFSSRDVTDQRRPGAVAPWG